MHNILSLCARCCDLGAAAPSASSEWIRSEIVVVCVSVVVWLRRSVVGCRGVVRMTLKMTLYCRDDDEDDAAGDDGDDDVAGGYDDNDDDSASDGHV